MSKVMERTGMYKGGSKMDGSKMGKSPLVSSASGGGGTKSKARVNLESATTRPMCIRGQEPKPSLMKHFKGHKGTILALDFHPRLDQVLSSGSDGYVMIWDFKQNKRALRFEGHGESVPVHDCAYSHDGELMVSGGADGTVIVWVPIVNGQFRRIKAHFGVVRSVAFSPVSSTIFATASDDKAIKVWDLEHTKPHQHRPIKFRDPTFLRSFLHRNWVRSTRFDPTGTLLCSASDDKRIGLFDLRAKDASQFIETHDSPMFADFNPTSPNYIGAAASKQFVIYDIRTGRLVQRYKDIHEGPLTKFSFHPSGDFAITVSKDATIKILDIIEGRPIWTLFGPKASLQAVACSPNGSWFATGGLDRDLLVWEPTLLPYTEDEMTQSIGGGGGEEEGSDADGGESDDQDQEGVTSPKRSGSRDGDEAEAQSGDDDDDQEGLEEPIDEDEDELADGLMRAQI